MFSSFFFLNSFVIKMSENNEKPALKASLLACFKGLYFQCGIMNSEYMHQSLIFHFIRVNVFIVYSKNSLTHE